MSGWIECNAFGVFERYLGSANLAWNYFMVLLVGALHIS